MISAIALVLCIVLLAGCANTTWAYRHNGVEFPSGAYIFAQLMAASDAIEIVIEENAEQEDFAVPMNTEQLLTHTVEGLSAADWINLQAHHAAMRYYAVHVWSQRYDLEFDVTMQGLTNSFTDQIWGQARDLFETNGISRASVSRLNTSDAMLLNLFNTLYGEGGEREISDADLQALFAAEYLYANIFVIHLPLPGPDGTILDDEALEDEAQALMASFVPRLNNGDAFEDVIFDFEIALEELRGVELSMARREADDTFTIFVEPQEIPFYPQEFITVFQALTIGRAAFVREGNMLILLQRRDVLENEVMFDIYRPQLMQELMFDEFRDELVAYAEQFLQIEQNSRAISRYRPANLQLS